MDPLLANAAHIARHRSKQPFPSRGMDDVTPAYGGHEMVKLTRLIAHEDTMTRDQALLQCASDLQKPQHRAAAIQAGIVPALQANLGDASLMVRAHTADAIEALAKHPLGTAAIVEAGTHAELLALIDDSEATVRTSAYKALIAVASCVAGAPAGQGWSGNSGEMGGGGGAGALTDCPGFVTKLVSKCLYEPEFMQPFAFELLGALLQQTKAVDLALLSMPPAIETMVQFLDSPEVSVRQKAAHCLSALSFPHHAKPMATSAGAIEKLVALLSDSDFQVRHTAVLSLPSHSPLHTTELVRLLCAQCRSAAASALASITVDEQAREHCASATPLLSVLPKICADPYDQVQLFAIKLLAVFLERPEWRNVLRESCQPILEEIVSSFNPRATDMTRYGAILDTGPFRLPLISS